VPAAGADRTVAVFGALDDATGQVRSQLSLQQDSHAFVGCLEQRRQAWPQAKVIVALDKVGDPNRHRPSAWWRRWLRRIGPVFLPAYTPELNLMERDWRQVKDTPSCHRWGADWQALGDAPEAWVGHLQARFHQPNGPALDIVQNVCATT
jgi:hypothetical protein